VYIGNAKRLLIIPDGPLHLLPLGALVRNDGQRISFLAEWKALHIGPSFSAYQEIRSLPRSTARVAFGNPNFTGESAPRAICKGPSSVPVA
jgi:CHAT domain